MDMPTKTLNELGMDSSGYKVCVKVVGKSRPLLSLAGSQMYQEVLLQDREGAKMAAVLFGEHIIGFRDTLKYNCAYEIANASIRVEMLPNSLIGGKIGCRMIIDEHILVTRTANAGDAHSPDYMCLADIPRSKFSGLKFDVLGTVLYVKEKARPVVIAVDRKVLVREMVVTDHSTGRPLIISACSNLAKHDMEALVGVCGQFRVVGFTDLKISSYRGYSLRVTTETELQTDPVGSSADKLREWNVGHPGILLNRRARVLQFLAASGQENVISIAELKFEKVPATWQYEIHWIRVTRVEVNMWRLKAYIGCGSCSRRTNTPLGGKSRCTYCRVRGSVATHMLIFRCGVYDSTGKLSLTMRTAETSRLFGLSPADIYRLKKMCNRPAFSHIQSRLQDTSVLMKLAPSSNLSRNKILWWGLKELRFDERA